MAAHNELGKKGEQIAVDYLLSASYAILETNYRFSKAEIDIIARKDSMIIFVEVKTRSGTKYGVPELFITRRKVDLMMDAAYHYMESIGHNWEIRFDVISLLLRRNSLPAIKHIQDAFVP